MNRGEPQKKEQHGLKNHLQATLDRLVPYDATQGQEGVSIQGVLLITLLGFIGLSAWLGLSNIDEGFNAWSWLALALMLAAILLAGLSPLSLS